jgi:hypothetical protein
VSQLTMVILACTVNVSADGVSQFVDQKTNQFYKDSRECKTYEHVLSDELQQSLTPFTCIMRSPIYITQFMEQHPGMMPRKWSCRLLEPSKDT